MNKLLALLEKVEDEIPRITWENHHPDYPEAITELMATLSRSDLIFPNYQKHNFRTVIENIEQANLEQLQCALTVIVRSERWFTGAWKTHLEQGNLQLVIKQLAKLENNTVNH